MGKYDETMMATAFLWAEHATCSRLHVGCVFARDERVLVQGYNGAPKGMPHCDHRCNCGTSNSNEHAVNCKVGPEGCQAVHAEQNAIAWAARQGIPLLGSTAYSTHQPCLICARLLVSAGVSRVVYKHPYRLLEGLVLLEDAGVSVGCLDQPEWRISWEYESYDKDWIATHQDFMTWDEANNKITDLCALAWNYKVRNIKRKSLDWSTS